MTESDTQLAERVLKHLFQGAEVSGMRFQTPQILFDGANDLPGEGHVNLGSRWTLYDRRPDQFPTEEDELPELSHDEELQKLLLLRGRTVARVEILSPPHLVLTFDDGKVFLLNGKNEKYEPWQAGQIPNGEDIWLVVACPGGGLAVWAPDEF